MSENNQFGGSFKKDLGLEGSNGMGMETADSSGAQFPGSQPTERAARLGREQARQADLVASGAMSMTVPVTNAGIVLSSFGGAFGEGGAKPDIQGGANK